MRSIEALTAEGQAKPARRHAPPRSRAPRPSRVFDEAGNEVFITMMCPHCRRMRPLRAFGLRRMAGGQIRNCPWCKACRSNPSVPIQLVVRAP